MSVRRIACDPARRRRSRTGHGASARARLGRRCARSQAAGMLGVCLGMQLLFERSEESDTACLGLLPGCVRRLDAEDTYPHTAYGLESPSHRSRRCLDRRGRRGQPCVFRPQLRRAGQAVNSLVSAEHGIRISAAVVRRGNICGMQFHPERSGPIGARQSCSKTFSASVSMQIIASDRSARRQGCPTRPGRLRTRNPIRDRAAAAVAAIFRGRRRAMAAPCRSGRCALWQSR